MSEDERRKQRMECVRTYSDERFLFMYATRKARLAKLKTLRAPREILEKEIQLVAEAEEEAQRRNFTAAHLEMAVKEEKMNRRLNRAS